MNKYPQNISQEWSLAEYYAIDFIPKSKWIYLKIYFPGIKIPTHEWSTTVPETRGLNMSHIKCS